MRHTFVLIALATAAMPAFAGPALPSYDGASALVARMQKLIDKTPVWELKSQTERLEILDEARSIEAAGDRLFGTSTIGPFSTCRAAAIGARFYIVGLNNFSLTVEGRLKVRSPSDLLAPMNDAAHFGRALGACQAEVAALARR